MILMQAVMTSLSIAVGKPQLMLHFLNRKCDSQAGGCWLKRLLVNQTLYYHNDDKGCVEKKKTSWPLLTA